jgi:PAS domain S-box-containing protein
MRSHGFRILRVVALVMGGLLVFWLPAHLARTQHRLRRQAAQALLGDAQGRGALAAVFLSARREEVRELVDSGTLQQHASKPGGGAGTLAAIGAVLREFGRQHKAGAEPCYSTVAFVSRQGELCSEAVADAPPAMLTFEALRSLVSQLYLRPTYRTVALDSGSQIVVLSVAVVSGGSVHGQLLAMLNPRLLDSRLQDIPAFAHRAVYLVSPEGDVLASGAAPREWQEAVREFPDAATDEAVLLTVAAAPSLGLRRGRALAARAAVPACEFALVCVEPAAVPSPATIVRWLLCYLAIGGGLFGLALSAPPPSSRSKGLATAISVEQAQCFETLFGHLPEGVMVAGLDGFLRRANRAVLSRAGLAADTLQATTVRHLLGEVLDEEDRGVLNRALQGRQPWFGRMRVARHGGSPLTAETAVLPIAGRDRQPVGIVVLQRDVSAEVQVADRLRQAQKMEAIGVLADGIAHDFNNLLTVIQGNCALLLSGSDALLDSFARDNIGEILRACDRAAAMTRRLLAFSRHKVIQLETLDLNEVVRNTEKMLTRLIRENIDMSLVLAERPVMVKADIVQMELVIINLTVNARDAMPRGGRLTLRVGKRAITTRAAGASLEEGEYAVLTLEDTGHGMDEATRRRIFEPFFTTKAEHEGTGLGLTTVHSIVKEHGGDITVQSQVGQGSTFTVWLPLLPEHVTVVLPGSEQTTVSLDAETEVEFGPDQGQAVPPEGTGILVLDDEESVLRMIDRGLRARGYTVFAARTDIELLVQWEEHRDEIALLVTDIVMPGMSGIEVAERLRQDRPGLKVLSISAYTDTVIMKLGASSRHATSFLQKPFTPDDLALKVQQMLAAP